MALIINESMPKACCWYDEEGHCIRCFYYGVCPYEKIDFVAKRPPRCPILGEMPDKHGRLVEADEITEAIIESARIGEITGGEAGFFTAIVHNAKTIIPSTIH